MLFRALAGSVGQAPPLASLSCQGSAPPGRLGRMTRALWTGCGLTSDCKRRKKKGCNCAKCSAASGDGRLGRRALHGAPERPGQLHRHAHTKDHRHPGSRLGSGQLTKTEQLPNRRGVGHLWQWDGSRYLHLEPAGQREIAPGHRVPFTGGKSRLKGWHVTPPNLHVVHAPPPAPQGGLRRRQHVTPGVSVQRAGHYGWSPELGKHVWIDTHENLSLDPSQLPPALRGPVTKAIKATLGHTHAHTAWGVTGHRTWVIPGHWQWDKKTKTWEYVERHVDQAGAPHNVRYPAAHAPSAAFGPRPHYLPPKHFWPHGGQFTNQHGQRPADAAPSVTLPPHARYAQQNGLLDPMATAPSVSSSKAAARLQNAALALHNAMQNELYVGGEAHARRDAGSYAARMARHQLTA